MAWLENYDPTPPTQYEMEMEPGPPSLSRALALLAFFLLFSAALWWMATALHASLPKEQEPVMVRGAPAEGGQPPAAPAESMEVTMGATEPQDESADLPAAPEVTEGEERPGGGVSTAPSREAPGSTAQGPLTEAERHFLKAEKLYDEKSYKAATEEIRRGLALEPGNSAQRAMLAMVLSYQGAWEESAKEYRKVLKEHPDEALLHLGLGVSLYRGQHVQEAMASLEKAVKLDPSLDEAKKMLELLSRAPEGDLEKVWFEHNVLVKGWEGFWIHTACTANFWGGRQGVLRALFYYEDGREIPGAFSNLILANGQAAIEGPFTPPHRKTRYKDLHLFYPYKGLRLEEGEYRIKVQLALVGPTGSVLATRWGSLRLEVLKTAFGGTVEKARSSSLPATSTQ